MKELENVYVLLSDTFYILLVVNQLFEPLIYVCMYVCLSVAFFLEFWTNQGDRQTDIKTVGFLI